MNLELRGDLIAQLEMENDTLRARVAQLEAFLTGGNIQAPLEWGLTTSEEMVFGALASRELATKEFIMTLLYRGLQQDEAEIKIVDVLICKLRKKIRPFGVEIRTHWGRGFSLSAEARARLKIKHNAGVAA